MTYEEAKEYLSSATFLYFNVTDEEYDAIPVASYRTYIDGVSIAGTNEEISTLASKQLRKGSITFT